ncbi:MAG TPA: YciI family protein [Solirubrobacteraceae bacterium]|nr:YciI family protein [Solirubrobacteraceae bacterium]
MHHLLIYEYVEAMAERRGPYRETHLARVREQRDAGYLTMAGALGDPPTGAAFVFKDVSAEHIEAFVAADPYFAADLVPAYRIEVWNLV